MIYDNLIFIDFDEIYNNIKNKINLGVQYDHSRE